MSAGADIAGIEQAKRDAAIARARIQTTAGALKQRLSPKSLMAGAVGAVRAKTAAVGVAARKRPVALTLAAGIAALILFGKPVKKVTKRLSKRRRERGQARHETTNPKTASLIRAASSQQE